MPGECHAEFETVEGLVVHGWQAQPFLDVGQSGLPRLAAWRRRAAARRTPRRAVRCRPCRPGWRSRSHWRASPPRSTSGHRPPGPGEMTVPPGWTTSGAVSRASVSAACARRVSRAGGSAPSSTSRIARLSAKDAPPMPGKIQRALPPPSAGSTKQRRRFQSIQVTRQLVASEQQQPRPVDLRGEQRRIGAADLLPAVQHGELRHGGERRRQLHEMAAAETLFGLGTDEQHPAVGVEKPLADQVRDDRARGGPERPEPVPPVPPAGSRPPGVPGGTAPGSAGPRCGAARAAGRLAPPSRRPHSSSSPAASSRPPWSSARNRQLRAEPGRRPVRPSRCRNEATVAGASIWMTRSRSPTSMPEFQRAGRDDHAVSRVGERLLGPAPFVQRQRRVRQERGHPTGPQRGAEFLDQTPADRRTPAASRPGAAPR